MPRRKRWPFLTVLEDHLIPNKRNNHHAHALRHGALFGYSAVLILLKALVVTVAITFPGASVFSSAITRPNIIQLTNSTRSAIGLESLAENSLLDSAAQTKANDMLQKQYFAHTSPEGVTPWNFINGAGYYYQYAGENLAVYYSEAEDVLAGWMASPTHRANIVDERYNEIGVGVSQGVYNDYDAIFVVQMFGYRPESVQENIALAVATEPEEPPVEPSAVESVTVLPVESGYDIAIEPQEETTAAIAQLGNESTELIENPTTGTWEGHLDVDEATLDATGDDISVVLTDVKGETNVEPIAWIGPQTAASLYGFGQASEPYKLFGVFPVSHINDTVNEIYLVSIVILSTLLTLSIIIKIEKLKHSTLSHALIVISLAAVLILI